MYSPIGLSSCLTVLLGLILTSMSLRADSPTDLFNRGEGVSLEGVIPANERGILSLAVDDKGHVFGGTTGLAAHFFVHDPTTGKTRHLLRLSGGDGLIVVHLVAAPCAAGTEADPTGLAVRPNPATVGCLYRLKLDGDTLKKEEIGVPVAGQGIYALAHLDKGGQVVGNTWP